MSQPNKKRGTSGSVLKATPEIPANNVQPAYPPPPGYRFVHHQIGGKIPGAEMAIFLAAPARNYREWIQAALAYVAEHEQDSTNTDGKQIAELPILEGA